MDVLPPETDARARAGRLRRGALRHLPACGRRVRRPLRYDAADRRRGPGAGGPAASAGVRGLPGAGDSATCSRSPTSRTPSAKLCRHQRLFGRAHPYILLRTPTTSAGVAGRRAGANRSSRLLLRVQQVASTALLRPGGRAALDRCARAGLGPPAARPGGGQAALFRRHFVAVAMPLRQRLAFFALQPLLDASYTLGVAQGLLRLAWPGRSATESTDAWRPAPSGHPGPRVHQPPGPSAARLVEAVAGRPGALPPEPAAAAARPARSRWAAGSGATSSISAAMASASTRTATRCWPPGDGDCAPTRRTSSAAPSGTGPPASTRCCCRTWPSTCAATSSCRCCGSTWRTSGPGGQLILITPQERGFASDPSHVEFMDLRPPCAAWPTSSGSSRSGTTPSPSPVRSAACSSTTSSSP